jgi:hypothetical protein
MVRESRHDVAVNLILVGWTANSLQIALIVVAKIREICNQAFIKRLPDLLDSVTEGVTGPEAGSTQQLIKIDAIVPVV